MKNSLVLYFVYGVMGLILLGISLEFTIKSVIEVDYLGVLLWSFILCVDLNDMIERHRNFTKYYPHFEDKWLYFL